MPPAFDADIQRIEGDKEYRDELRFRCITDGFFLAPLLGYFDFREDIHRPVAELYVQKKPGVGIADQDPIKRRLHLDPRHTFKTTWGFVDTVQWILTDPNVTIVNETATQPLGKLLTQRIARAFIKPKTKPATILQRLFPEYVVEKLKGDYRAPCTTRDEVEPTLYATSVGSAQSGYHPWIINPDDMVDEINSGIDATDGSREAVWNTYSTNRNTVRTGGYEHIRGTRYHPFDLYGRLLQAMNPDEWKYVIRSSMSTVDDRRLVEGEFPNEDEVTLNFPTMLPYIKLRGIFRENYRSFMRQQQNDPQGGGVAIFPAKRYLQAQIEDERIPTMGEVRISWRLQCEAKGYMKYAEGMCALYVGAKVYFIDAWRGIFTPTELAERIIAGAKRRQCNELIIENTPGSDSMIPHIQNEAVKRNWTVLIDRPDFDNDDAVRIGRMKNLEPMMGNGRLWFSRASGQVDEVRNQFTHFGLVDANGFVDVASRLALRAPNSVMRGDISTEDRERFEQAQQAGMWHTLFGQGGSVQVEEAIKENAAKHVPRSNSYGLRQLLGGLDG